VSASSAATPPDPVSKRFAPSTGPALRVALLRRPPLRGARWNVRGVCHVCAKSRQRDPHHPKRSGPDFRMTWRFLWDHLRARPEAAGGACGSAFGGSSAVSRNTKSGALKARTSSSIRSARTLWVLQRRLPAPLLASGRFAPAADSRRLH